MNSYISMALAAERAREMQAQAAKRGQVRQARQPRGPGARVTRHPFHLAWPWTRRSSDPAADLPLAPRVPAQRASGTPEADGPARKREHVGRAA